MKSTAQAREFQAALLEAMSDGSVSIDGVTHKLHSPFMLVATDNPYEFEGTFPLPENQLRPIPDAH